MSVLRFLPVWVGREICEDLADCKCSDAFAGGFMSGVVDGKDVDECVDRGQWLAALGIKELGPS